jgi:hypothetical protein
MPIKLSFEILKDPSLRKKVKDLDIIRLKCVVQFERKDGGIELRDAIVDTGAYVSLIPLSIWKHLLVEKVAPHEVKGLSSKPECSIPVTIGRVGCSLVDEYGNRTGKMKIYAYLSSIDEVPTIIGFKDLLDRFSR